MSITASEHTADVHRRADAACGREWVCTCGACMAVRRMDAVRAMPSIEAAAAENPRMQRRSLDGKLAHAVHALASSMHGEATLRAMARDSVVLPLAVRGRQRAEMALLQLRLREAKRRSRHCASLRWACPGCAACLMGKALQHQASTADLGRAWNCGCDACVRMRGFSVGEVAP